MLSVVTLDDSTGSPVTLHQDAANGKRWLAQAHGLRGIQGLRDSKRVRPQAHGGINETRYEDGRNISLVGEIMSTVSIEDAFSEFALIAAPMIQTLDNGPALLKWQEGSGILNYVQAPTFMYSSLGGGFIGSVLGPAWFIPNDGTAGTVIATPGSIHAQGLRVNTAGVGSHEGYSQGGGTLPAGTYTASVWVAGNVGGEALQVFAGITSPGTGNGTANFTATTTATRYSTSFTSDGVTPVYLGVRTQGTATVAFVIDSMMITSGLALSPYFDGDTNGDWLGTPANGNGSRSGHALQRLVKLDGDLDPPFSEGQAILSYQAQFFAEDPRAYSQTLQTVSSTALSVSGGGRVIPTRLPFFYSSSGGGTVSFTNAGNRPTSPLFRIYGACVNPSIVLVGTGIDLVFNGTIANGDYLEIDAAKRTVKLNGTTNRLNFYDGANSTWFDLPAGTSNLQLVAASFDGSARLDVIGRSAFA